MASRTEKEKMLAGETYNCLDPTAAHLLQAEARIQGGEVARPVVIEERVDSMTKDWICLAFALYSLAHNDPGDFDELEPRLKNTEVGRLCSEYIRSGDARFIEDAGYLLTGTKEWYVYLGRVM